MHDYQIIVGNIGTVHDGHNKRDAERAYRAYVADSRSGTGPAGNEPVVLMQDGEPLKEHKPPVDFQIERTGNLVRVTPMNDAAREWLDENCQTEGWEWMGPTLHVDARMAPPIVQGITDAGFTI